MAELARWSRATSPDTNPCRWRARTGSGPPATSPRRVRDSGHTRTDCRRRGSAGCRGCAGSARRRSPAAASRGATGFVDSTQTSADCTPSPMVMARASGAPEIRQKPPGMTCQPSGVAAAKTRSTNGRGTSLPSCQTGVVDSCTTSCPTKSTPRSSIASRSRACVRASTRSPAEPAGSRPKPGSRAAKAPEIAMRVESSSTLLARLALAAPPGRDIRQRQLFAEQMCGDRAA